MRAVILAAGMGTRLGGDVPKPLTPLMADRTIIDLQIAKLEPLVGRDNITVVIGYEQEQFMDRFPDLNFVINEQYQFTNTAKSLLLALKTISNESVLWMNGDIFFDDSVLDYLTQASGSTCLVDTKQCGEEEIKYTTNERGTIDQLSKQVQNAEGEALGINLIEATDLSLFTEQLESVGDNDYFEKALEELTTSGRLELTPVDIETAFCQEIDFPEDLAQVQAHLEAN
ncbi:MAG: UDP-N-acetylglucosamine pyrophosphorylase [Candidatus Kerfeldbacteria bacterium CG15_BIG_FIL_POST_REV_8_21_14_020_45_12]|uniref:UDP-N-acetylglucosamine pyrophosphorylase n=1 Tax=Candidatus Kerfeldbacteria bacterium CG15_BIG_FIL_POST_REV_8_21_14_020_45_12 TaxID=2014247 RepID=A0A2M7H3G1_9BACT|nr:MAG: UDP-N-acetylglucosamine pyrophosphorylase [Candidatus Kerfeldbacteria bacterium CG15_BIG_FIL_POST_REV_8_21_14_020_45_12]PJA93803.1 MAG: UDP-N-acetylglucosamine pyrophosphorylase [Candidatus Kerfeldbacteria bacterium CG_4_9_14_3_um_filter_45_8]